VKLGVILLNWNSGLVTAAAARMAAGWKSCNPAVFVVDNGSADNCRGAMASECPQVNYYYSNRNLGYAGGNNIGIKKAIGSGCDTIMLLNNDATLREEDVNRLAKTLNGDRKIGIVGPLLKESHNGVEEWSAGGRDIATHIRTRRRVDAGGRKALRGTGPIAVDYVPGTVLMARSFMFRNIGMLEEEYFFSGEIADFCESARRGGFSAVIDPEVEAAHVTDDASLLRATLYRYYNLRNRFLFIRRHRARQALLLRAWWIACGMIMTGKAALRFDFPAARAARLGLTDGLAGHFGDRNNLILGN
jgi:GT2 family glycosyltransferase